LVDIALQQRLDRGERLANRFQRRRLAVSVHGHVPILSWNKIGSHKPQHCSGTSSERESGLLHFRMV
jgi:hypothetical protein